MSSKEKEMIPMENIRVMISEEDRIKEFIAVLDTCEYARYAPGSNSDQEMGKVYTDSIDVITKLDKAIR